LLDKLRLLTDGLGRTASGDDEAQDQNQCPR
jgi:hypothetical protein